MRDQMKKTLLLFLGLSLLVDAAVASMGDVVYIPKQGILGEILDLNPGDQTARIRELNHPGAVNFDGIWEFTTDELVLASVFILGKDARGNYREFRPGQGVRFYSNGRRHARLSSEGRIAYVFQKGDRKIIAIQSDEYGETRLLTRNSIEVWAVD